MILKTIIVFILCPIVFGHNWMHSQSRAMFAAVIVKPAPPKPLEKISHYQVARNQKFALEYVTGHPKTSYYFVVMKASDEFAHLGKHGFGDHRVILDPYLDNCPPEHIIHKDPQYKRRHVSYGSGGYADVNQPTTTLPETSLKPGERPTNKLYKQFLAPGDALYFDRPDVWKKKEEGKYTNKRQWEYRDEDTKNDIRCAAPHPYIISAHRFTMLEPHLPEEWDYFFLSIDAPPGEYIVHMMWEGYRDVMDVDVLPGTSVNDVYGTPADTIWVKQEHCQYPNYKHYGDVTPNCVLYTNSELPGQYNIPMDAFGAAVSGTGNFGINVIPVFNPTCKIYITKEKCELMKCEWFTSGNLGRCRPIIQQKLKTTWKNVFSVVHYGTVDLSATVNDIIAQNKYPNVVIRRRCFQCSEPYTEIYYKRINPNDGFDYSTLFKDWTVGPNEKINVHFEIYPSIFDLLAGTGKWENCPDGKYNRFPGRCGRYAPQTAEQIKGFRNSHDEFSLLESLEERELKNVYEKEKRASCKSLFISHMVFKGYEYYCGGQSEDGCWCDMECQNRGDCCQDYQDFCAKTRIGHQCQPDKNECNANADCLPYQGTNYCKEKCFDRHNGNPHNDGEHVGVLCRTQYGKDFGRNEFKHYRNMGCWEDENMQDLQGGYGKNEGWVSDPKDTYTPRYCYLQCKARGFKYFAITGPICACGNSYGNEYHRHKRPFKFLGEGTGSCFFCIEGNDMQDAMEGCGGGNNKSLYEITECPNYAIHFGDEPKFVSPHLCWVKDTGSVGADYCKDSCLPVAYQTESIAKQYLAKCPGQICDYYLQETSIGDNVNGFFRDGSKCDRRFLREAVEARDESAMAAFGFLPKNPLGYFNVQAGTQFELVTDDPEDPIFYSTCFKKEVKRSFTNGAVFTAQIPGPIDWRVGEKCLDCNAIPKMKENWVKEMGVVWWNTTSSCQKCTNSTL